MNQSPCTLELSLIEDPAHVCTCGHPTGDHRSWNPATHTGKAVAARHRARVFGELEGKVSFGSPTESAVITHMDRVCADLAHLPRKPRPDLIPAKALLEVGLVLAWGEERERRTGSTGTMASNLESAIRHVLYHVSGETNDPESGMRHLAHAGARILYAISLL